MIHEKYMKIYKNYKHHGNYCVMCQALVFVEWTHKEDVICSACQAPVVPIPIDFLYAHIPKKPLPYDLSKSNLTLVDIFELLMEE